MQRPPSPSSPALDDATLDEVLVASNISDQTQLGTQPDGQRSLERFYSVDDTFEGPSGIPLLGIRPFTNVAASEERAATLSGLIQSNSAYEEGSASPLLRPPGVLSVSSPAGGSIPSPLLAAVLNTTGWSKGSKSLKKDKTAAVLAELRRPAGDDEIRKSARVSADDPAEQTSGISAFSQIPVSELLIDDLEDEPTRPKAKWYKRVSWWYKAWPVLATCCLLLTAGLLRKFGSHQKVKHLEWWRLCFFLATLAPICWVTSLAVKLLVMAVESQLFIAKNVLYFMAAIKRPLTWFLRSVIVLPAFVGIMLPRAETDDAFFKAYDYCIKFLGCWIIFCAANVVKALLAKRMASHFHKQTHFQKMRDAIKKEYYLLALAEPRRDSKVLREASLLSRDPQTASTVSTQSTPHMKPASSLIKPAFLASMQPPGQEASASQATRLSFQLSADSSSRHRQQPSPPETTAVYAAFNGVNIANSTGAAHGLMSASDTAVQHVVLQGSDAKAHVLGEALGSAASDGLEAEDAKEQRKATGQSHWAKLRMAHRTATKFKPPSNADTAKKVEKHIRKNKLTAGTFSEQVGASSHANNESTDREARKLAFFLYWNIKPTFTRNHILPEDLEHFLNAKHAAEAFEMLDDDKDGHASLKDVRSAVCNIFKERANLSVQLKDTKTVVGRLESVVGLILHIVAIFLYLIIFDVPLEKTWVAFSSIVLAFAFVFGNSVKTLYESIIYLFVVHPFDVGDKIIVESVTSKVEEITLNATIVRRSDGGRMWYSNTKLAASNLINVSRSDAKSESFKFMVDISTPASVLDSTSQALQAHMDENLTEYKSGSLSVSFSTSDNPLKVQLAVSFEYSHNGVDGKRTEKARCGFLIVLCQSLAKLSVVNTSAPSFPFPSEKGLPA
ncbi:TPA: hypothetical protein ACH3X1_014965 [Trebouxia sp. C0004]